MRHVIRHWTEIRYYEFPDDAPVHDEDALAEWIDQHPQAQGDWEYFTVKAESDGWEMVDIIKSNIHQTKDKPDYA